jgi:hypothetical protein
MQEGKCIENLNQDLLHSGDGYFVDFFHCWGAIDLTY